MSDGGTRAGAVIERAAERDLQRPVRTCPTKGKTGYPFAELEVGESILVARTHSSVRAAIKRFQANNRDSKRKFETWTGSDKRIVVKRIK